MELKAMGSNIPIRQDAVFSEIDYGVDENRPEAEVEARIGREALDRWNREAIPPEGWNVDVAEIEAGWRRFAAAVGGSGKTVMVVTSNGIARFALRLVEEDDRPEGMDIKLATGAYGVLVFRNGRWFVESWNVKLKDIL